MTSIVGRLWANEPVIVGTIIPLLVTAGFLTVDQASAATNIIAGVIAVVAQLGVAAKIRSLVSPLKVLTEDASQLPPI
jgi:hypothetical protein